MKEVNFSTKLGEILVQRGTHYEGKYLNQVYENWSEAKQEAWNSCFDDYLQTEDHEGFSICGHNTFSFSVSWFGKLSGEDIMRLDTAHNSYLVWLER